MPDSTFDADRSLRRIERTAIAVCLGMAAMALVVAGGRPGPALAVLAGGLLIGVSYWTIGLGVHALAGPLQRDGSATTSPRARTSWTLARVVLRYALLALLAYVMIARLRLHPIGLLAGASSVVAAASLEALRFLLKKR
jgi:ATP synthase I chain